MTWRRLLLTWQYLGIIALLALIMSRGLNSAAFIFIGAAGYIAGIHDATTKTRADD